MKKKPLLAVALGLAALSPSCIGPNNCFGGLHSWNGRVTESRWWNEVIHVGLWVVPVYEFALLGDIVIFNSIEFWGAENPFSAPQPFEPQSKK